MTMLEQQIKKLYLILGSCLILYLPAFYKYFFGTPQNSIVFFIHSLCTIFISCIIFALLKLLEIEARPPCMSRKPMNHKRGSTNSSIFWKLDD
jgi:hypothetical protein